MEAAESTQTLATGDGDLVRVSDLRVRFVTKETTVYAVNGVDFSLAPGEVLGILGESGSGKTVTLRALIRLLPEDRAQVSGRVLVGDNDMLRLPKGDLQSVRGRTIAMIFQEPMTALDPVYTVGYQIAETIVRHESCSWREAEARALDLFEQVQVPSPKQRLKSYPHELSGGLRQRAMIALALSCRPGVLLADEPTTALDATVQIQILLLLRELQKEMGVIFVTHDMGVAGEIADRLAIMYAGRLVETGPVTQVMREPLHPYTKGLLSSTVHGSMRGQRLQTIEGSPPNLEELPDACSFAPRCPHVREACREAVPEPVQAAPERMARCILVNPA
ncbi:MAG: ABC transporter ATP-binding protein [Rhodospirillales bacterium]|jgi:peptide/nickel transport system ATP-binding protein|nr:ABC transporter ATP-binding protein [Rhodospirillales bacterium]